MNPRKVTARLIRMFSFRVFREKSAGRRAAAGFTFVEVLATLVLAAIVLPVAMRGISTATTAASESRKISEATTLAQNLLVEILISDDMNFSVISGDFEPKNTGYRWNARSESVQDLAIGSENLRLITVEVLWMSGNTEKSIDLATMVYMGDV